MVPLFRNIFAIVHLYGVFLTTVPLKCCFTLRFDKNTQKKKDTSMGMNQNPSPMKIRKQNPHKVSQKKIPKRKKMEISRTNTTFTN